jgi:ATP-dependent helicase/nuclease subunit B
VPAIVVSASAEARLGRAREFLARYGRSADVVVVADNKDALADLLRSSAERHGALFGWQRVTFARLGGTLAAPWLADRGLVAVGALAVEALCARLVHREKQRGTLERLAPIADFPGLPKALGRTLEELRLARIDAAELGSSDVARLVGPFVALLEDAKLADRALVLEAALARARAKEPHPLLGRPMLMLDVAISSELERELVEAILRRSPDVLVTVPEGDEATLARVRHLVPFGVESVAPVGPPAAVQAQLFAPATAKAPADALVVFSAPGENRECVEIARLVKAESEQATRFDRMAVLLHTPSRYRAHLEEAMRRAGIPVHFARGTARPDPSGRALLALIACQLEELSATRFAEYMSLGELPRADTSGAPPPALDPAERWALPDTDLVSDEVALAAEGDDEVEEDEPSEDAPVADGSLRAPRLWERLLVDAAVIGEKARWKRRLEGLENQCKADIEHLARIGEEAKVTQVAHDLHAIQSLRDFALPILEDLESLPVSATWGEWIDRLSALASRALRNPTRVQSVLAELARMGEVGPVDLREVRVVLEQRLTDVVERPSTARYGKVFVATPEEARGMEFDIVFVPGLAEKMFPQKVIEDPILPDALRARVSPALKKNDERSAAERLALRLAVGAAGRRVIASYPRIDVEQARPRTPSFYALELHRAAEGVLPGFDDLARRASSAASVRIGWPAPVEPGDAIDEAEYDLAILERLLRRPAAETVGAARYLLNANPHLGRALRFRAERWNNLRWYRSDGLVHPSEAAHAALREHDIGKRSFSPTALQNYAACPYRFLLQAVHRLAPRDEPAPIEELDPLQRGSMMHEAQFETLVALREARLLPVTPANLSQARAVLDKATHHVAVRFEDELKPAIPRVWEDGVARMRADLAEWLRRMATDENERSWIPVLFELSFGLRDRRAQQDDASHDEPVELDCGIKLRGSIDLVEKHERSGQLRATDHKSGKVRATEETVIGGGKILQPVLYALAVEKLLGTASPVWGGRLYYCTSVGEFKTVPTGGIPLDVQAREEAKIVADTVHDAIHRGFLPAAPAKGECEWCDYARVCGPYEEQRTARKPLDALVPLSRLRERD